MHGRPDHHFEDALIAATALIHHLTVAALRLTRKTTRGKLDRMASKSDTVKAKARELIEQLPDTVTWDDVAYEIAVRRSVERGLDDIDAGRTYTSEALLKSLGLSA
ncbi:hypothetical protein [Wenzhouxiangella limi]|nr:hypothetical protein [Wenzhouxiangella limi]